MKKVGLAIFAAIAFMGTESTLAGAAPASSGSVIPVQQQSLGQMGANWWKWALSIPYAENPEFDTSGVDCAIGQKGGTWFLAGTPGGSATRSCTIPAGKAIFFPVVNVENDYPCPDPAFQPAPGQSLKSFLTYGDSSYSGAVTYIDRATGLEANLDGASIPVTSDSRGTSNMYTFTGDPSMTAFDGCITGSPQKAVSDGYWILLAPLSAGSHTLSFGGTLFGNPESATYNLTVE